LATTVEVKAVKIGTAWFHNRIDNYIDERLARWFGDSETDDFTRIVQRQNAKRAVFEGVESALEVQIRVITLSANLTWLRREVFDNPSGYFADITDNATQYPARRSPRLFGFHHPYDRPRQQSLFYNG
jgi:outer membrane receptor for ferrienterochelin and colicin